MTRAVLDTNIWLGSILWRGMTYQTLRRAEAGDYTPVTSNPILHELVEVLRFDFNLPNEVIFEWWVRLSRLCDVVHVASLLNVVSRDPDDNKFIECAVDGRCKYVVSKDHHLLDLKRYNEIEIVRVDDLLEILNVTPPIA